MISSKSFANDPVYCQTVVKAWLCVRPQGHHLGDWLRSCPHSEPRTLVPQHVTSRICYTHKLIRAHHLARGQAGNWQEGQDWLAPDRARGCAKSSRHREGCQWWATPRVHPWAVSVREWRTFCSHYAAVKGADRPALPEWDRLISDLSKRFVSSSATVSPHFKCHNPLLLMRHPLEVFAMVSSTRAPFGGSSAGRGHRQIAHEAHTPFLEKVCIRWDCKERPALSYPLT